MSQSTDRRFTMKIGLGPGIGLSFSLFLLFLGLGGKAGIIMLFACIYPIIFLLSKKNRRNLADSFKRYSVIQSEKSQEIAKSNQLAQEETVRVDSKVTGRQVLQATYLGGIPNLNKGGIFLCPLTEGLFAYTKLPLSNFKKSAFLLPWQVIKKIEDFSELQPGASDKSALLTVGLLKNSGLLTAAGLLAKSDTMKKFLRILCIDNTGYENVLLFEVSRAANAATYLNEQRLLLYASKVQPPDKRISIESDGIAKLERLSDLLKKGIITEEEFQMKKKDLLSQI